MNQTLAEFGAQADKQKSLSGVDLMKKIQIIAIIAAAITFFCVLAIMVPKKSTPKAVENKQTKVVVAVQKIDPMTVITKEMLKTKNVSAKDLKSDAYSDISKVVGKIATEEIDSGDQITESNTDNAEDSKYGLAVKIPKGMRAVTLSFESDAQGALDNLLKVGNTVDVIAIYKITSAQDTNISVMRAQMIMQKKQVVAVDNTFNNQENNKTSSNSSSSQSENESNDTGGRNITLLVTPQESIDLLLYQQVGKLKLTLRSQTDDETVTVEARTVAVKG